MGSDPTRPVVIVGGGFCGTLAALQLLRADAQAQLLLLDKRGHFGRGLAFGHHDDNLLLDRPAGELSARADEPEAFTRFCQDIDPGLHAGSHVSRRLYGDYLQAELAAATASAGGRLRTLQDEALALAYDEHGPLLQLASGARLPASSVVLAPGLAGARDPLPVPGLAAFGPHLASPWDLAALDLLPRERAILVLGRGEMAVDALFRLTSTPQPRPILMVNPLPEDAADAAGTIGAAFDPQALQLAPLARHRLQRLLAQGAVEQLDARVLSVRRLGSEVVLSLRRPGAAATELRRVGAAVNAIRPERDLASIAGPLLQQLRGAGRAWGGEADAGITVDAGYAVHGRDGAPVPALYYLGALLPGLRSEATSLPALRDHAAGLAAAVLAQPGAATGTALKLAA